MSTVSWGILAALMASCASVPRRDIPSIRVAMQELVSADESDTGLAESRISEIIEINFESYLAGVLAGEVPSDWPTEALKAQAVASRSYALHLKANARSPDYDLLSSTNDQVFRNQGRTPTSIKRAVKETTGETLFVNGNPLQAYFHSCCGGATERPADVWPSATGHPLQVSVPDPFDAECPDYRWSYELSKVELLVLLSEGGHPISDFSTIVPSQLTPTGRIKSFRFIGRGGRHEITANELRRVIGYQQLKSANFRMTEQEMEIHFEGKGSGHGVGMCQWGARGMALAGYTYDQILAHFYPGAVLQSAY